MPAAFSQISSFYPGRTDHLERTLSSLRCRYHFNKPVRMLLPSCLEPELPCPTSLRGVPKPKPHSSLWYGTTLGNPMFSIISCFAVLTVPECRCPGHVLGQ